MAEIDDETSTSHADLFGEALTLPSIYLKAVQLGHDAGIYDHQTTEQTLRMLQSPDATLTDATMSA